jgi:hypothetical protein
MKPKGLTMHTYRILMIFAALTAALSGSHALAQPDVPDALEPWSNWVLHGEDYRRCPVLNGAMPGERAAHVCAWPGNLNLTVDGDGADFSQRWQVDAEEWLPLAGSGELWPADVRLDGVPAAVIEQGGRPVLRAGAGRHTVTGRIGWAQRPAAIPVPPQTALVTLSVDGTRVARPEIERGSVWLGLAPEAAVEEDRLAVAVYRLIADGIPVRVTTEIQLDVAGQGREIALADVLLDGFTGEQLDSPLPAQLDGNGTLRIQVRPGNWRLRLVAHAAEFGTALTAPAAAAPWPAEEIWSFAADTRLRVAVLEGAPGADSRATEVPADWQSYPAYRVSAGTSLELVERSRNDADEANRLSLNRLLWLDFAGDGFTALDAVSGTMNSGWRLDMSTPYLMTMATTDLDNPTADNALLVTSGNAAGTQGVELRDTNVELYTTARIESRGTVPVTGFTAPFDDVQMTLHLPPGHRLLAAPGADAVFGAWLNDWRLLDLFLALIVATAAWRLLGIGAGLLAAGTMVLIFHEPAAPHWLWLNVLVAIALLRVAPEGRLHRLAGWYRAASLAALVLMLIPFAVTELRNAVYPQLEQSMLQRGVSYGFSGRAYRARPAEQDFAADAQRTLAVPRSEIATLEEMVITPSSAPGAPNLSRYLPGAVLQTGPGLPDWAWTRATLRWTSPVDATQDYRLIVLGRWSVALWRIAAVLTAGFLLWLLARSAVRLPTGFLRGSAPAALLLLATGLAPPSGHAQSAAEFPSQALLDELKTRLTEPAPCHPGCADITRATAELAGNALTIELQIANQAAVAVPLPGSLRGWRADAVDVDGTATTELYTDGSGRYWLPLPAGVHAVRLRGVLPAANSVTIPFPLVPRTVTADLPGWDIGGISNGRLVSGSLELVRQQTETASEALGATEFAPYVRVIRTFEIGLDWTLRTSVERIAPVEAAFTILLPLLDGEAVLTPGIDVADGAATVAFSPGQRMINWQSRLEPAATLTLTSSGDRPAAEHWIFRIGQLWHAEFAGIPRVPSAGGPLALEYLPRPDESLTVSFMRPEPASGDTIAIDSVDYSANVGERLTQSTLNFTYRSTRAQQHIVTLPEGSELDSVVIDDREVPLRLDANRLELPVTTGEHTVIATWRSMAEVGAITRLATVDLGAGTTNLRSALQLPSNRWVLWTFGPSLGSAVLYWSELIVFVLLAVALGRLSLSPLHTHEWLLLGLGLSTFAWPILLLFAAWAFAMSWRSRMEGNRSRLAFNALQIGLGMLTVAAIGALLGAIPTGLLGAPDMQIVSPAGYEQLSWFEDRSAGVTPSAGAISISIWFYRAAMLAWALWLSFALLRWLPWAWRAYAHQGLWLGKIAATP